MSEVTESNPSEEPPEIDPFVDEAPPETAPVRTGEDLDWAKVEAHLRAELPDEVTDSGPFRVEQFPNGSANLTYLIGFGQRELVLRRPPFGTLAPGAHDMKREFTVLSQLWQHFDRAPRAYLFCQDDEVAGADFFVMERRRGEVIRSESFPESMRTPRGRRPSGSAWRSIDAIAEFHLLDPDEVRTRASSEDPTASWSDRWRAGSKRWDLVAEPRAGMRAMKDLHRPPRAPRSCRCPQRVSSLMHNDLKLDNCMFDPGEPRPGASPSSTGT